MSTISPALEQEICRLARREVKAQVAPTRQAIVEYRREIARLKRLLSAQQRALISLQSRLGNSPDALAGVLEGIQQAARGEWIENPPDFKADVAKARKALEKIGRKKPQG